MFRSALAVAAVGGFTPLCAQGPAPAVAPIWRAPWTITHPSPTSTVVELPGGTVEILGLKRWSPAAIEDSLARKAPGSSIASPACAVALRERLGFAEAAALYLPGPDSVHGSVVVAVVEPDDAARVRHRMLPLDTTAAHQASPWPSLVDLAANRPSLLRDIVATRFVRRQRDSSIVVPSWFWADTVVYRATWTLLDQHRRVEDLRAAVRLLESAPNPNDRLGALTVLSSFAGQDAAWHALVGALRESDGPVRDRALELLELWTRQAAVRPIDWAPAAADLHAILDGTYLDGLHTVLDILARTHVAPALGPALLKDGGHAALMYAGAQRAELREPALAVLRRLSGRDLGRDVRRWEAWVAGL